MVLQDGTIPKPGCLMFFDNTEWATFNGDDEWATEPGLHLGVTPWLAIGTTTSIIDEGNGWHYLSTTPYLNLPLFKSDRVPLLKVSLYAGYEFPDNVANVSRSSSKKSKTRAKVSSNVVSTPSSSISTSKSKAAKPLPPPGNGSRHLTGGGTVGGGGPDAPTGGTTHDHPTTTAAPPRQAASKTQTTTEVAPAPVIVAPVEDFYEGIHRHGEEGLHARLIIDVNLGDHDKVVTNVINFTPAEGSAAWGYAVGYRHAFNHDLAASLEAVGDFDGRGSHEVLLAVHRTIDHHLTLKLGVGTGLTPDSPDASVHAGIVWRF